MVTDDHTTNCLLTSFDPPPTRAARKAATVCSYDYSSYQPSIGADYGSCRTWRSGTATSFASHSAAPRTRTVPITSSTILGGCRIEHTSIVLTRDLRAELDRLRQ